MLYYYSAWPRYYRTTNICSIFQIFWVTYLSSRSQHVGLFAGRHHREAAWEHNNALNKCLKTVIYLPCQEISNGYWLKMEVNRTTMEQKCQHWGCHFYPDPIWESSSLSNKIHNFSIVGTVATSFENGKKAKWLTFLA